MIAVQLTNNTDTILNVGKDVAFFSGENQIFPMEPNAVKESIKQIVPAYLPYLLLTFVNLNVTQSTSSRATTEVYPIGLALGPGITLGNMYVASSANKIMLNELYQYNILRRDIQKGETVYGIIAVRDLGYSPLSVKRIK
ncbi:MAG: hypothetical protein Q8S18_13955 [Bacteroidales bacterium]|nr:hypothetical protein [Bacteroidales bacterium]